MTEATSRQNRPRTPAGGDVDRPQTASDVMASIPEEKLAVYREAFALFDKNGDGSIEVAELKSVLFQLGRKTTKEQVQDLISQVDIDNTGSIEFPEFLLLMSSTKSQEEQMFETFRVFDRDGNGYIERAELREVMAMLGQELSEEEITEILSDCDLDGDGRINYREFVKLMGVQSRDNSRL